MRVFRFAFALGLVVLSGCSSNEKKAEASTAAPPAPIEVNVVPAQSRKIDKSLAVTGALHPDETVQLSSEEPGRLSAVYVDFGQTVKKGQVVAELDKRELTLQVERSRAALSQALARLGLNSEQEHPQPESTPAIRQAVAQMEDARSKFQNAEKLVKSGDISQERFTEMQKAYQVRQAGLEASRDEARTLFAAVEALRTEVKLAQKRLGDLTVHAPFDGEVSERLASAGQFLRENAPILTIVKTNPLRLRLEVPESAAGTVKVGSTLLFTTDAAPGKEFPAVIRELNPSLDSKSRTLTCEARLQRSDAMLRPGMFVQVQLVLTRNNDSVFVPKAAIYNVAGLTKLFVIEKGKAVERRVSLGQELDGWMEVPGDQVSPGDQIAVSSLAQLVPGAAVIAKTAAKSPAKG